MKEQKMLESPVRFVTNQAIMQLISRYCPRVNASILDVGCGKGNYQNYFFVQGIEGRYLGIDIKEDNSWYKEETKVSGLKVSFRIHSAESLEDLDERFNFICSIQTLEHIEYDQKVMKGMEALLNNEGHILITVPSKDSFFLYGCHGYRRYNVLHVKELANQSGLSIEELVKLGGIGTFVLHFVLWTIPAVIFGLKIWRAYERFRLTGFIQEMENLATKVDKIFPWLEGGYTIILKGK